MKRIIFCIILSLFVYFTPAFAQFSPSSGAQEYKPTSGGINSIYLFNGLGGASLTFISNSPSLTFRKFNINTEQSLPAPATYIGGAYVIDNLEDGWGYFPSNNESPIVWVIDYSQYLPQLTSITLPEFQEDNCNEAMKLVINPNKQPPLQYKSIDGITRNIPRKFILEYQNLKWDGSNNSFINKTDTLNIEDLGGELSVTVLPLKDTQFKLSGDQFAKAFGIAQTVTSEIYTAVAVEAYIEAVILRDGMETDSIINNEDVLSAPLEVQFYGHTNEPTANDYTWTIYYNKNPNYELQRRGDKDLNYTFTKAGEYNVVFEAASNFCAQRDSVVFTISESSLDIPNFFSPGSSPGVNDEFKVKHKSLVKFKATIFNRWGNKIYEWKDPDQGWDGKYNGKYVSPGVYFYVIDATGSDGIRYKRGGDINILRGK